MEGQLSPDEKFHLITRNLQVRQTDSSYPSNCLPAFINMMSLKGGPWRGEAEADPAGERAEAVLGHSDHRQTSRSVLCPNVQDSRLPQGWM